MTTQPPRFPVEEPVAEPVVGAIKRKARADGTVERWRLEAVEDKNAELVALEGELAYHKMRDIDAEMAVERERVLAIRTARVDELEHLIAQMKDGK